SIDGRVGLDGRRIGAQARIVEADHVLTAGREQCEEYGAHQKLPPTVTLAPPLVGDTPTSVRFGAVKYRIAPPASIAIPAPPTMVATSARVRAVRVSSCPSGVHSRVARSQRPSSNALFQLSRAANPNPIAVTLAASPAPPSVSPNSRRGLPGSMSSRTIVVIG